MKKPGFKLEASKVTGLWVFSLGNYSKELDQTNMANGSRILMEFGEGKKYFEGFETGMEPGEWKLLGNKLITQIPGRDPYSLIVTNIYEDNLYGFLGRTNQPYTQVHLKLLHR